MTVSALPLCGENSKLRLNWAIELHDENTLSMTMIVDTACAYKANMMGAIDCLVSGHAHTSGTKHIIPKHELFKLNEQPIALPCLMMSPPFLFMLSPLFHNPWRVLSFDRKLC